MLSVVLFGVLTTLFAQEQTFGIVSYTTAPDYKLIRNDKVLTWYKEDTSTGAYCNIFIYDLMPGYGNVLNDFDFAWSNQVQNPFKVTGQANKQPVAVLKGWQFIFGTTNYADNGVATLVILICFSGENNMQSICILSNSDNYKKDIEAFIASVDVVKNDVDKTNAVGIKTSASVSTPNIKYEVWVCNCPNLAGGTQVTTKLNTVVLSPDGRCLYYMPQTGLNGINPENSNQDSTWGNVTDKGNRLSFVNDKYGKMELYKINTTSMSRYPNSKSSIYKKVKPTDDLRFEGAYSPELSYYSGKADALSRRIDQNKRPVIFFKKDGSYINEGITFSNLTFGDDFAIGKGSYQIVNYSLILTTGSGRKLQVAFTPVPDANPGSPDNPGFIINNKLFYRLGKQFMPHTN